MRCLEGLSPKGDAMKEKTIIYGRQADLTRIRLGGPMETMQDTSMWRRTINTKLEEMLKYSKDVRSVSVIVEESKVTVGYAGS